MLGTNASSDDVTYSATTASVLLETDGTDNDQIIVAPHLDSGQTAWTGIKWGSENQTEWECSIRTPGTITAMAFWAGLKLTNVGTYATDADQVYFVYATDDDMGAMTNNGNLFCVYSIANVDYITDLGVTIAASTLYHLKVVIDSDRKVSAYVNGTQYSLAVTAVAGGVTTGTGTTQSIALTNDKDFIPYIGVQSLGGAARSLGLQYQAISRYIFE